MRNKKIMFCLAVLSSALVVGTAVSIASPLVSITAEEKNCNFTILDNEYSSVANTGDESNNARFFSHNSLELETMNVFYNGDVEKNTLMYVSSFKTPYIATSGKAYDATKNIGGLVNGLTSISFGYEKLASFSPVKTQLTFELKVWNSYDEAGTSKTFNIVEKQFTEPGTKGEFTQKFEGFDIQPNMFKLSFTGGKKENFDRPVTTLGSSAIVPSSLSINCTTLDAKINKIVVINGNSNYNSTGIANQVKVSQDNVELIYNGIQPNYLLSYSNKLIAGRIPMDANIKSVTTLNDLNQITINAFIKNDSYEPTTATVKFFNNNELVHTSDAKNIPVNSELTDVPDLVFALPADKVANGFEIVFDYPSKGGNTILLNSYAFDYNIIAK